MKITLQPFKYFLVSILVLTSLHAFAQCTLKGNKEVLKNWRAEYFNYFSLDSATAPVIKADSVLIFYFSNPENETNYGMPCCYYLAEKYAQVELKRAIILTARKGIHMKLEITPQSPYQIVTPSQQSTPAPTTPSLTSRAGW